MEKKKFFPVLRKKSIYINIPFVFEFFKQEVILLKNGLFSQVNKMLCVLHLSGQTQALLRSDGTPFLNTFIQSKPKGMVALLGSIIGASFFFSHF